MNGLRRTQEVYTEAQGRQARLTGSFFEASQALVEQARRGQSAGRNLAREGAANPYEDFLECLFFYYRKDARAAEKGSREG